MNTRPRFASALHEESTAAILGIALGVSFFVCFVTGLESHLVQHPPSWFEWPSRPAGLYRFTQGLHVVTGIATVPLLLAKLWVVFPKLFQWPPFENFAHAIERVSLLPLIGGALFLLSSGIANIAQWYPWPFGFRPAHYTVAWITIGALIIHIVAKWSVTRTALARADTPVTDEPAAPTVASASLAVERRNFLITVFGTGGLLALLTVGQTASPLEKLALLAPRRPSVGPQGFPVNRTAAGVGVLEQAQDPAFRLVVEGNVRRTLVLSRDDLSALPKHVATLPIACVEGWSANQTWTGPRVRDLLAMAGARPDAEVTVHSLQGSYATDLNMAHTHDRDTLLALEVRGEALHVDHGYPVRLIGPNRPGTTQIKWVNRLVVR